jgi:hypothetical protein
MYSHSLCSSRDSETVGAHMAASINQLMQREVFSFA